LKAVYYSELFVLKAPLTPSARGKLQPDLEKYDLRKLKK